MRAKRIEKNSREYSLSGSREPASSEVYSETKPGIVTLRSAARTMPPTTSSLPRASPCSSVLWRRSPSRSTSTSSSSRDPK